MQKIAAFSMVLVDLRALHTLMHRMELFSSGKLISVWVNDITSEYFSSLFSEIFWASSFMTLLAEGPAPPVDENTRGLKVMFSTSLILCPYLSFLSSSWYLEESPMVLGQVFASGLKILTSKKVLSNTVSQRPLAFMSRRTSSAAVELLSTVSLSGCCINGSTATLR